MQYLPSDSFGTFSCNVWKAAPLQAVISCGPLKSHSKTCPSAHFKANRFFPPPFPAVTFSLFHISSCPPDLLGSIQQGHKKVAFDWWTKWRLSMREKCGMLQSQGGCRMAKSAIDEYDGAHPWSFHILLVFLSWFIIALWIAIVPPHHTLAYRPSKINSFPFFSPYSPNLFWLNAFSINANNTRSPSSSQMRAVSSCLGTNSTNKKEWGLKSPSPQS